MGPLLLLVLASAAPPPSLDAARLEALLGLGGRAPAAATCGRPRLVLLGTLTSDNPSHALAAAVDIASGAPRVLRVGGRVPDGVVAAIERGRVRLALRACEAVLEVGAAPEAAPAPAPVSGLVRQEAPGRYQLARAPELDDFLDAAGRPTGLVTPATRDGRMIGLRLARLRPGSLAEQLGLRSGDVLVRADGVALDSLPAALELAERARVAGRVVLEVEREGRTVVLAYALPR